MTNFADPHQVTQRKVAILFNQFSGVAIADRLFFGGKSQIALLLVINVTDNHFEMRYVCFINSIKIADAEFSKISIRQGRYG